MNHGQIPYMCHQIAKNRHSERENHVNSTEYCPGEVMMEMQKLWKSLSAEADWATYQLERPILASTTEVD